MNRIYIFLLLGILLAVSCEDRFSTLGNLNKDQSYAFSLFDTTGLCKPPIGIFISKEIVPGRFKVLDYHPSSGRDDLYSPSSPTWLIFVDLKCGAYWYHECTYHFVDISSGKVFSSNERTPPEVALDTVMIWGKLYEK